MLPQNSVSDPAVTAPFFSPDDIDNQDLVSFELGGIALNDPSQGRMVQVWTAFVTGQDVMISADNHAPSVLFSVAGALSAVSLAFDSNMQPAVSFTEDGVVKLYWFDTLAPGFVTTSFPGLSSPSRLSTDDKRQSQEATSDVIFGYVKDGVLYWRQQRDRYTVEYTAGPVPEDMVLYRMGMNTKRRFQFELREP